MATGMEGLVEVIVNERSREYYWLSDGGEPKWDKYRDVVGVRVSASGNHYLRLSDGNLAIVRPTWDSIHITPETPDTGWTF